MKIFVNLENTKQNKTKCAGTNWVNGAVVVWIWDATYVDYTAAWAGKFVPDLEFPMLFNCINNLTLASL